MSKLGIKRKVRKSDNKKWEKEMEGKPTISLYREYKKEIKDENIYDNRDCSRILYWARSNTLKLDDWYRHQAGGEVGCKMCGGEWEDLMHFTLKCRGIEDKRNKELIGKMKGSCDRETMGNLLFRTKGEDLEEVKKMLKRMWNARKYRTE